MEYSDATTEGIKTSGKLAPSNMYNMTIKLNLAALNNASQEYVLATIYHEIIHAYLRSQGIADSEHHNIIASEWRQKISDQLWMDFPYLSEKDADALSWGGLGESNLWQTMLSTDANNNTGITGAIAEIDTNHRNINNSTQGNYGTQCAN